MAVREAANVVMIRYPRFVLLLAIWAAAGAATLSAQSTVFIVRHADRGPEEPDALLTPRGLQQADELAAVLADANIRHVYTTDVTRTKQTAAPTAKKANVTPIAVAQDDLDGLIAQVRGTLRDGESTLVVGHRSSVPKIAKALTGKDIPLLAFDEFTRLTVATIFPDGRTNVVTLRFGFKP